MAVRLGVVGGVGGIDHVVESVPTFPSIAVGIFMLISPIVTAVVLCWQ